MSDIAKYLYEIGQLKRVVRSGWWLAGIQQPESVAEHSFRVAVLGYILACLEGADIQKAVVMCLFHDTQETRVNDSHKVAQAYISSHDAEQLAFADQVSRLPPCVSQPLLQLAEEFVQRKSLEALIAKDADLLECLLQAREYYVQGYHDVAEWISSCRTALRTETARQLAEECIKVEPKDWWEGLKLRAQSSINDVAH
jgi:putative hydrolases of HD superfamily